MAFKVSADYCGTDLFTDISMDSGSLITYGGSTIDTITAVGTKTLNCAGKMMSTDVAIGTKTLNCANKMMRDDVVLTVESGEFFIYSPGDTGLFTSYKPDALSWNGQISYKSTHMYLSVNSQRAAGYYSRTIDFSGYNTLNIRLASAVALSGKTGWFGLGSSYSTASSNKVTFSLGATSQKTITKDISSVSSTKLWCYFTGGSNASGINVYNIWLD